jgi:hypothetical protein
MTGHEPDSMTLPLADLLDVERHIDRDLMPERWARLQAALAARRAGTAPVEHPTTTQPVGPVLFMVMHMIVTVIVLVGILAFPGDGGESAVGRDLALLLVVPVAFFVSAASIVFHKPFLRARRPGMFLLASLVITPFGSVAVLVIGSSVFWSLLTLFSR